MYRIRRFGVIKTATIVAVMYLIGTAVVFVPLALVAGIAGVAAGGNVGAVGIGIAVVGLLFAVGWVGGIELQLEAVAPPPPPQAWAPATTAPPAPPPS